jgi:hypothetical protein
MTYNQGGIKGLSTQLATFSVYRVRSYARHAFTRVAEALCTTYNEAVERGHEDPVVMTARHAAKCESFFQVYGSKPQELRRVLAG